MVAGSYSEHSIKNYLVELRYYFSYYVDDRPSAITAQQAEVYLQYLGNELKCSHTKIKMAANAIGFFFRNIKKEVYYIPAYIHKSHSSKLPPVMTMQEVKQVLGAIANQKHNLIIALIYSTGIRISEACKIKLTDISFKEKRIKIVDGKGKKDRYVQLCDTLALIIKFYLDKYQPSVYLINGQGEAGTQYSARSIQIIFSRAIKACSLDDKNYSVHTLRHSYATHLVEQGTDIHAIQQLLGHSNLKQTMLYLHLSKERFRNLDNPLDGFFGNEPNKE